MATPILEGERRVSALLGRPGRDEIVNRYRIHFPAPESFGLCYATRETIAQLHRLPWMMERAPHVTVVEDRIYAQELAGRSRYDFILAAGPAESQLDDIIALGKASYLAHQNSTPVYILGETSAEIGDLLHLFGQQFKLKVYPTDHFLLSGTSSIAGRREISPPGEDGEEEELKL